MRRNFLLLGFAALMTAAASMPAAARVDAVNQDEKKIAMHGYDAVAYFTDGRPVKGATKFAAQWRGASWMFATAEHRDQFQKEPEKYAPQYGGYCAWAVSKGYTANGDPEAWRIVNGKLYLNYSKSVQKKWEQDTAARIQEADRNWPALHN
ncbi:MAG: YHS domain-containing (seleno)protein [Acidobacteriota bacterium]